MPNDDDVDALKRRIAELEQELAELKRTHASLLEAAQAADLSWGEFNPG